MDWTDPQVTRGFDAKMVSWLEWFWVLLPRFQTQAGCNPTRKLQALCVVKIFHEFPVKFRSFSRWFIFIHFPILFHWCPAASLRAEGTTLYPSIPWRFDAIVWQPLMDVCLGLTRAWPVFWRFGLFFFVCDLVGILWVWISNLLGFGLIRWPMGSCWECVGTWLGFGDLGWVGLLGTNEEPERNQWGNVRAMEVYWRFTGLLVGHH